MTMRAGTEGTARQEEGRGKAAGFKVDGGLRFRFIYLDHTITSHRTWPCTWHLAPSPRPMMLALARWHWRSRHDKLPRLKLATN